MLAGSLRLNAEDNFAAMVGKARARRSLGTISRSPCDWGDRASAINPYNANVYGVIGDAQLELGRYEEAFDTFQTMVDTRPSWRRTRGSRTRGS